MRRFPVNRLPKTPGPALTIEKDEFLQRTGIEFAISAKFERDLRHAIGFAARVDRECVCFAFCHTNQRVAERRQDKGEYAVNQYQERQPCRIGNPADGPSFSPALDRCMEKDPAQGKADENKKKKISEEMGGVVEHVMSHLVCHDLANFGQRALVEQIVI